LNPVFDQWGELPLLPFGNPIGFVPASRGGIYIKLISKMATPQSWPTGANQAGRLIRFHDVYIFDL